MDFIHALRSQLLAHLETLQQYTNADMRDDDPAWIALHTTLEHFSTAIRIFATTAESSHDPVLDEIFDEFAYAVNEALMGAAMKGLWVLRDQEARLKC